MADSDPPKRKRRRFQFSLKTLMLLVTTTAATLGLLVSGGTFALTLVLPMAGAIVGSFLCAALMSNKTRALRAVARTLVAAFGGALGVLICVGIHSSFHPGEFIIVPSIVLHIVQVRMVQVSIVPAVLSAVVGVALGFFFYSPSVAAGCDSLRNDTSAAQAKSAKSKSIRRPCLGLLRFLVAAAVLLILFKVTQWWPVGWRSLAFRHGYGDFAIRGYHGLALADTPGGIRELIRILEGDDWKLHGFALLALDYAGSEAAEAAPVLAKHLNQGTSSSRKHAASALRQIGPEAKEAAPALARAVEENHFRNGTEGKTHYHALWALGRIGPAGREAVPVLSKLCEKTKGANTIPEYRRYRMSVTAVLALIAPDEFPVEEAVATLIAGLKDEDRYVHRRAVFALGEMGPLAKEAVPALIDELQGPARHEAVLALGKIGPAAKEAIPALTAALGDASFIPSNVGGGVAARIRGKVRWGEPLRLHFGTSPEFILWNLEKIDPQAAKNAATK